MTRQRVAAELNVAEPTLRLWERDKLLLRFNPKRIGNYMLRVRLITAARAAGLSGQEVRKALHLEPEEVGDMTDKIAITKPNGEVQQAGGITWVVGSPRSRRELKERIAKGNSVKPLDSQFDRPSVLSTRNPNTKDGK